MKFGGNGIMFILNWIL